MGDPADGENAQRAADNRGYGTDGVKAVEERRLGMVESSRADSRGFDDLPYAGFRTVIGGTEYNSEERPEQCDAQRVADFVAGLSNRTRRSGARFGHSPHGGISDEAERDAESNTGDHGRRHVEDGAGSGTGQEEQEHTRSHGEVAEESAPREHPHIRRNEE